MQQEGEGQLISIESNNTHVLLGSELVNFHPTVHRPWGTYTVLEDSTGYKIKRIEVKPVVLNLVMIEVQSGDYLEEDDIVRFDDVYGRA